MKILVQRVVVAMMIWMENITKIVIAMEELVRIDMLLNTIQNDKHCKHNHSNSTESNNQGTCRL